MANTDAPMGFKPVGHFSGGVIRSRTYVADEENEAIYPGDCLTLTEGGKIETITAGNMLVGVSAQYLAANTGGDVQVFDDPNIIYEVQGYTGVTFTQGHVGETGDPVATAGSSTTKLSLQEMNEGGNENILTPKSFLILGKVNRPGNAWGEHVKLLVKPFASMGNLTTAS